MLTPLDSPLASWLACVVQDQQLGDQFNC